MEGRVSHSRGSTSSSSSGIGTSGQHSSASQTVSHHHHQSGQMSSQAASQHHHYHHQGGQLTTACQAVSQHHQSLLRSVEDAALSLSLASISSEGSTESHLVEQEDIVALSTSVRGFKEALGKLRKLIQSDRERAELRDGLRVRAHEKLAEVLRTLRTILKNYCPIMHPELMTAASYLISQVNDFKYEDEKADPVFFLESIDQLALAFSSRVSEYLMGDIDTPQLGSVSTPSRLQASAEALHQAEVALLPRSHADSSAAAIADSDPIAADVMDDILHRHDNGVELCLHRAKLWSKYAKDLLSYVDQRAQHHLEHAKSLSKLARSALPGLKEENFLPLQAVYITALEQDQANCGEMEAVYSRLKAAAYIEPLTSRRSEHERSRKAIKEQWHREHRRLTDALNALKKAKATYQQRHQELARLRDAEPRNNTADQHEKMERKRDEAANKVREATALYQSCVTDANEKHASWMRTKRNVIQQTRELLLQFDLLIKTVTTRYFQMQQTVADLAPVQLQALAEKARLYDPGSQYMMFVKRVAAVPAVPTVASARAAACPPFSFEQYGGGRSAPPAVLSSASNGSVGASEDARVSSSPHGGSNSPHEGSGTPVAGSDTDSVGSGSSKSQSPSSSPTAPPRRDHPSVSSSHRTQHTLSSGDELEADTETDGVWPSPAHLMKSKAAETHSFRKLKTPSRCRECDSYVYFHGHECGECGLACHKKCLETLALQCGHKRLPRKMNTFGVDLAQLAGESRVSVPHLISKCIREIDLRGTDIKGIYRVSGLKTRVEKLCQAFENGAHLVDLTDQHPNVIANVLKLYLRQLPEPLFTFRLYPDFIRIAKDFPANNWSEDNPREAVAEQLKEVVSRIPQHFRSSLAVLMLHLHRVASNHHVNNMPPSNLGIVFGPTLLRTTEGSASLSSLVDTVHQTRAVELLVEHAPILFPVQEADLVNDDLQASSQRSQQQNQASLRLSGPSEAPHNIPTPAAAPSPSTNSSGSQAPARPSGGALVSTSTTSLSSSSSSSSSSSKAHSAESAAKVQTCGPAVEHRSSPTVRQQSFAASIAEDDWDWQAGGSDSPEALRHLLHTGHLPPASHNANIVKKSLRDYVGLETSSIQLSSSGCESGELGEHARVRKTLSDTPPGPGEAADRTHGSQSVKHKTAEGRRTTAAPHHTHAPSRQPLLQLHERISDMIPKRLSGTKEVSSASAVSAKSQDRRMSNSKASFTKKLTSQDTFDESVSNCHHSQQRKNAEHTQAFPSTGSPSKSESAQNLHERHKAKGRIVPIRQMSEIGGYNDTSSSSHGSETSSALVDPPLQARNVASPLEIFPSTDNESQSLQSSEKTKISSVRTSASSLDSKGSSERSDASSDLTPAPESSDKDQGVAGADVRAARSPRLVAPDGAGPGLSSQAADLAIPFDVSLQDDKSLSKDSNLQDDIVNVSQHRTLVTSQQKISIVERGEKRVSIKEPPDNEKRPMIDSEFDSGRRSLEDVSREASLENLAYSDSSQELEVSAERSTRLLNRDQDSAHDSAHDSHSSVEAPDDADTSLCTPSVTTVSHRSPTSYSIPSSHNHGFIFAEPAPTDPSGPSEALPVQAASIPVQAAPIPAQAAPIPALASPMPAQAAPMPVQAAPMPAQAIPMPAQATPIPVQATPISAQAAPMPVQAAPIPVQPAPGPHPSDADAYWLQKVDYVSPYFDNEQHNLGSLAIRGELTKEFEGPRDSMTASVAGDLQVNEAGKQMLNACKIKLVEIPKKYSLDASSFENQSTTADERNIGKREVNGCNVRYSSITEIRHASSDESFSVGEVKQPSQDFSTTQTPEGKDLADVPPSLAARPNHRERDLVGESRSDSPALLRASSRARLPKFV